MRINYIEALSYYLAKLSNIVEKNNNDLNIRVMKLESEMQKLKSETPPLLIIKHRKEVYYEAA